MSKIFFDLDGTLIDSKPRLYRLFQDLVPISNLTFEEYWEFKKNKKSHEFILKNIFQYTDKEFIAFSENWMNLIEHPDYLKIDVEFSFTKEIIKELSNHYDLYILTARQFEERTIKQVDNLIGLNYFNKILVTKQQLTKEQLIKTICTPTVNDWIIGDTGKDIQTGKAVGIKTIAVLSGFLNKSNLINYNPDFIFDDISKINCFRK